MPYLPETVRSLLAGSVIRCGVLVRFDFLTTPRNLWLGFGRLWAGGEFWEGAGELGSISGLETALGGGAPQASFSLSGVDTGLIADALAASSEVNGRDVTVYLQFFTAELVTLDIPLAIYVGAMDVIRVSVRGAESAVITVTAETLFARRALPPFAYLSDRDQNRLYPGDRGLELISQMPSRAVEWPKFA